MKRFNQLHGSADQGIGAIAEGLTQQLQGKGMLIGLPGLPHGPGDGAVAQIARPGLEMGGNLVEMAIHHLKQSQQLRLQFGAGIAAMNAIAHEFFLNPAALVACGG